MPKNIQTLKREAEELNKSRNYQGALPLLEAIWDQEKSGWNGYSLAKCYRRLRDYEKANTLHRLVNECFPNYRPMALEYCWLLYSEKINAGRNTDIIEDAQIIIGQLDPRDKYSNDLYNKVVLAVIRNFLKRREIDQIPEWLNKLECQRLGVNSYVFGNVIYRSDLKKYYRAAAFVLVELGLYVSYLMRCFKSLGFEHSMSERFGNCLVSEITYDHYLDGKTVKYLRLARYLKIFCDEINRRNSNSFELQATMRHSLLVSSLGDFAFCPVSFAIRQTYKIEDCDAFWVEEDWPERPKTILDYYTEFRQEIQSVDGTSGLINLDKKRHFGFAHELEPILISKLRQTNFDNQHPSAYFNDDGSICGNPQYLFETANPNKSDKFVVVEKFTAWKGRADEQPFKNDLVRVLAYIFELETLQLDYGYLVYWYWGYSSSGTIKRKDAERKIVSCKVFKVERTDQNRAKLAEIVAQLFDLIKNKSLSLSAEKISSPKKCLHCSVMGYCNHKTGRFSKLELPYKISELTVGGIPKF